MKVIKEIEMSKNYYKWKYDLKKDYNNPNKFWYSFFSSITLYHDLSNENDD